ncbi:MAG: RecX family transcriptional regulator [Chitinophagales bacterium]|nr:RecX family transcriptional regulator [Chitinophagales bacterium]
MGLNQQEKEYQEQLNEFIVKLEYYCSYQERCLAELKQKMYKLEIPVAMQDTIIEHLQENNFYNEERFVASFINGKAKHKKWGKQKLTNELLKKQIDYNLIQQALSQLNEFEYQERLQLLLEKKASQIKSNSILEKKQKLYRFALQKGYDTASITPILNKIIDEK